MPTASPALSPDRYAALLSPAAAAHPKIDLYVETAEQLVLAMYTEDVDGVPVVRLHGYSPVGDHAPGLARALELTVALVAEYLASSYDPRVASITRGRRTVTYRGAASLLPPGWQVLLMAYGRLTPVYAV